MTTTTTRHVLTILAVADVGRAAGFYSEAFGWSKGVDVAVYVEFLLPGGMRLGLYEREAFGRNTHRVPARIGDGELTPTELYFYVDDLPAACARVARTGARELSPVSVRDWGDEAAYFADPDGNVVVVARPMAKGSST